VVIKEATVKTVVGNYLCVHKKLRTKRLAPILIGELKRVVGQSGKAYTALYGCGDVVPYPMT